MVTAPHIASPGPAAEPCYVYTGGSSVAWVSWLVRAVCKRHTASRRLSGYVGPRSRQPGGALCGGHATGVEHTLPASEGKGLNLGPLPRGSPLRLGLFLPVRPRSSAGFSH